MKLKNLLVSLVACLLLGLLPGCGGEVPVLVDDDGDGSLAEHDCNDSDPSIYPGADDPFGDGIDQDCDGVDGVLGDDDDSAGDGD